MFWRLTEAETMGIVTGHIITGSEKAANIRNLYVAMVKLWGKEKRSAEQIWPLPTDAKREMEIEDRYALYGRILENVKIGEC